MNSYTAGNTTAGSSTSGTASFRIFIQFDPPPPPPPPEPQPQLNAYSVLGLSPAGAQADEVHSAYRRLAREHHPDHGGDEAKMKVINGAFDFLRAQGKA